VHSDRFTEPPLLAQCDTEVVQRRSLPVLVTKLPEDVGCLVEHLQEEALQLADELLADIELSRAPTGKYVMKAMRLARLAKNHEAQEWLEYELNGVPNSPDGRRWMTTTRRWVKAEGSQGYWSSAAAIEAQVRAVEATMAGMGTTLISRDYAIPANRQRNDSLAASAVR
jgi:hypothetical protein